MKFLRTKEWTWWDIGLLKWCCILVGAIVGAYLADIVKENVMWFLLATVILALRPAITYWKD